MKTFRMMRRINDGPWGVGAAVCASGMIAAGCENRVDTLLAMLCPVVRSDGYCDGCWKYSLCGPC